MPLQRNNDDYNNNTKYGIWGIFYGGGWIGKLCVGFIGSSTIDMGNISFVLFLLHLLKHF